MEPIRVNRWRILVFYQKNHNGKSICHTVNIRYNTDTKSIQFVDTKGVESSIVYEIGEEKVLWEDFMLSKMNRIFLYRYRLGIIEHNINEIIKK